MSRPLPTDLGRIDPAEAWAPWEPDPAHPWDARWAAHLYRRAAFGATPEQLAEAVRAGFAPTVDRLLRGEPGHERTDRLLAQLGEAFASTEDIDRLRAWWLYGMLHTGHPLREKLTLFWHNHFATSVRKVRSDRLMYQQNQLLRRHALGAFGPFLRAIGRDVAMLVWLDSARNVKRNPNENYAREVMELFALGVGNYTERDVREAARAFTGWHPNDERTAFAFSADDHDGGPKTILGQAGRWNGDDVVRILLEQRAAARFLVGKLYRELVSETPPPPALLEPLAARFRRSGYRIDELVGTILRSRLFYSEHAFLRRVKSPVEFAVGAVRTAWPGPAAPSGLVDALRRMGQELFAPPNVKGWPGGRDWLSTGMLLARNNFAEAVALGNLPAAPTRDPRSPRFAPPPPSKEAPPPPERFDPVDPPPRFDVLGRLGRIEGTAPGALVGRLLELFLPGCAPARARGPLLAFVREGAPEGKHLRHRLREAAHAVLCLAPYQLC